MQFPSASPNPGSDPAESALLERRDRAIASALRRTYTRLEAGTCTVYLKSPGQPLLDPAATVDSPLSFTVKPRMNLNDPGWPSSIAYATGQTVVFDPEQVREVTRRSPSSVVNIAFPLTAVSVPIRTPRHRFGIIGLRFVPPRPINAVEVAFLEGVADELAAEFEELTDRGLLIEAPSVPLFISTPRPPSAGGLTGSSCLYQLQRLATDLTGAVRVQEIVSVAHRHMVRPFGGLSLLLCLAEGERLHVLGAAGVPREEVNAIEGTLLSRPTPETDAVNEVEVGLFSTVEEFGSRYPHLPARDPDRPARAYLPLISGGRAVGCCGLEFDRPGTPLSDLQIALLMIMLEQVVRSLERARAYEADHAFHQNLQRGLLPRSLPHLPEIVATARYLPAEGQTEVGGDWYDVLTLPDGGVGLVIGDVQGHGMDAAAVMGQLRSGVRAYAAEGHGPAVVLERSNRLLAELDTDLYATCCCVWLDLTAGLMTAATAGHPEPLISNADGQCIRPQLVPGPPLGIDENAVYLQRDAQIPAGAVIALFTNGLLDSRHLGAAGAIEELEHLLVGGGTEDLESLADRMIRRRDPEQLQDDAALVVVRYQGRRRERTRVARTSLHRSDLQGVSHIREFLRELMREWNLSPVFDGLALAVTEVVTNALIHAQSDVDLRLREYPDRIRVEVRDSDPYPPVPTAILHDGGNNRESESGRGLLILDALAQTWGSSPSGRGKTTWFEIGTADGGTQSSAGAMSSA